MLRPLFTPATGLVVGRLHRVASWLLPRVLRIAFILSAAAAMLLPRKGFFRLHSAATGQMIYVEGTQVLRYGAGDWDARVRDEWGRGGFHHFRGTDQGGRTLGLLLVPGWLLPSAATLAVGVWAAAVARDRQRAAVGRLRHRAGLCVRCGYDLRASPGRCPECGAGPA